MDKQLILGMALGVMGTVAITHLLDRPAIAQNFGTAASTSGVAATAPNAAGASHAWTVDLRTNSVVMCRGNASGAIACTQTLMPGAANIQR